MNELARVSWAQESEWQKCAECLQTIFWLANPHPDPGLNQLARPSPRAGILRRPRGTPRLFALNGIGSVFFR